MAYIVKKYDKDGKQISQSSRIESLYEAELHAARIGPAYKLTIESDLPKPLDEDELREEWLEAKM